jgi:hypothetical protein
MVRTTGLVMLGQAEYNCNRGVEQSGSSSGS